MRCSKAANAGFSIAEVLVVLVILSLTIAAVTATRPGPSPALQLKSHAATIIAEAGKTRDDAIRRNTIQTYELPGTLCPDSPPSLMFFANGTATGTSICLSTEGQELRLALDPLTGQFLQGDPP
jgi:prepilin-type N-terminal cleavage/methylation domain-containing protein